MKVKFVPQNVEFEIKPGQSVMHLAEDNGIYVKSVCRGVPSCAECRVKIVEGERNVFAPVAAELALIGTGHFIDRRRLSCQLQCIGDVTIDMSEQIAKQQGLIGGRKAKAAKAIGDRVEDETVIRDSSAGGGRRDRDDEDDERPSRDSRGPRGGQHRGEGQQGRGPRPQGQGPQGQGSGGGIQPQGSSQGSSGIQPRHEPRSPVGGSYGGQPPADADGPQTSGPRPQNQGGGQGGGGRSRRRRR